MAPIALRAADQRPTAISTKPPCTQLTHQAPASAQRTQAFHGVETRKSCPLNSSETTISGQPSFDDAGQRQERTIAGHSAMAWRIALKRDLERRTSY